jgi:hypothetical protein
VSSLAEPPGASTPSGARCGTDTGAGSVTLGGRRVPVQRPRVRAADGSGELPEAALRAVDQHRTARPVGDGDDARRAVDAPLRCGPARAGRWEGGPLGGSGHRCSDVMSGSRTVCCSHKVCRHGPDPSRTGWARLTARDEISCHRARLTLGASGWRRCGPAAPRPRRRPRRGVDDRVRVSSPPGCCSKHRVNACADLPARYFHGVAAVVPTILAPGSCCAVWRKTPPPFGRRRARTRVEVITCATETVRLRRCHQRAAQPLTKGRRAAQAGQHAGRSRLGPRRPGCGGTSSSGR